MSKQAETAEINWNCKPRPLESEKDEVVWALPAAFALVFKKIEDYDMEKNCVQMKLTIILRIKITDLVEDVDLLRDHLENKLKIRINESEYELKDDLKVSARRAKSKDWSEGMEEDMYSFTIRHDTTGETNYDQMASFPFDTTDAKVQLEISHFEIKNQETGRKIVYRFDCYQAADWLSWKSKINGMPDFGIDYEHTKAVNIPEKKVITKNGFKIPVAYYPGIVVTVPLPRASVQPSLNYFLPSLNVSAFVLAANNVAEFDSVMEVTGIALLTYVQLYQQVRSQIPNTRDVTVIEKILIIYMIYCLIPLIDGGYFEFGLFQGARGHYLFIVINVICIVYMLFMNLKQYAVARNREPKKQVKAKAEKKAPDASWNNPCNPTG